MNNVNSTAKKTGLGEDLQGMLTTVFVGVCPIEYVPGVAPLVREEAGGG